MDKGTLRDAINQLQALANSSIEFNPTRHAMGQFDGLLTEAKSQYPERVDIQSLDVYAVGEGLRFISSSEFNDSVRRLATAINLRSVGSMSELFGQISVPPDASDEVKRDLQELKQALDIELHKTVLLLAGSITESLLLSRHPDKSDRGPGLKQLVVTARDERLLGRDTLRALDTLIDYRDSIHPRAESRNKTPPNAARSETAINGLKLLCAELEDLEVRYEA